MPLASLRSRRHRVERLDSPRSLITPRPEFSWELVSDDAADFQTAWEIETERIAANGGTTSCWRSGKIQARLGSNFFYDGETLLTRTCYRWRVRLWNAGDGAGEWSDWQSFETGVIAPDSLADSWVSGGGVLRKEFQLAELPLKARAYVTGLGYFKFYCNGRCVSPGNLAPTFSDASKRVEYEVVDLAGALVRGANAVGFLLGDGWWRYKKDNPLCALAEICLEFEGGRTEIVRADGSWSAAAGPLTSEVPEERQQIYNGVTLDLRALEMDWASPGGAESSRWKPAVPVSAPPGQLVPRLLPPIQVTEELSVKSHARLQTGEVVLDFGQNFAGFARFKATGPAGAEIVVRYGELLHADGTLNQATLKSARATDRFILRGAVGPESLEPLFTYHGFRFVQLSGALEGVDWDSFRGCVQHTVLERTLEFDSSDSQLNWIVAACRWTVRSNLQGLPTDCCQRDERQGWLMDGYLALNSCAYLYDVDALYRKWYGDILDVQREDGSLSSDSGPPWFQCSSLGWSRAVVLVPYKLHRLYGDTEFLRRCYPAMLSYTRHLLRELKGGLLPETYSAHSSEWLSLGHLGRGVSDNATAYHLFRVMEEVALLFERKQEAQEFAEAARWLAAQYNKQWLDPKTWCYQGGALFVQSNQVYALHSGVVPEESTREVFGRLLDDLLNARGEGVPFPTTGLGSSVSLLDVLCEQGRPDIAWRLIQRTEYPGWGFMRRNGATSIWERWEHMTYAEMNAHNHIGLSGVAGWIVRHLAGLSVTPGTPPRFLLEPALELPLEHLAVSWQTRWGRVALEWKKQETSVALEIAVPCGCEATLRPASGSFDAVLKGGRHKLELPLAAPRA